MRAHMIVVVLPSAHNRAGVLEAPEQGLVEALVAQPAVEALDEGVPLGLAGGDAVPLDVVDLVRLQDRRRCRLGAVVADNHQRLAPGGGQGVHLAHHAPPQQRRVRDQRRALPADVVQRDWAAGAASGAAWSATMP